MKNLKKTSVMFGLITGFILAVNLSAAAQTRISFARGASEKTITVTLPANGEKSFVLAVSKKRAINVNALPEQDFGVLSFDLVNAGKSDNFEDWENGLTVLTGRKGDYVFSVSNTSKKSRTFKMKIRSGVAGEYDGGVVDNSEKPNVQAVTSPDELKIPAEVKPFIEKGTKAVALESADLNGDKTKDYVLVLEKLNPERDAGDFPVNQRPLIVLIRDNQNKLSAVKRSEKMVMCSECGGVMGDPFEGVEIGEKTFTVSHYGGSGIRWSARYKFNYSRIDKTWQLVEVKKQSYSTADVEDIKSEVLTPKDFGKIDVADFNPNDLDNLNAAQPDTKQNDKASDGNNVVTFNSFGKVKTGMTVAQAAQALGTELIRKAEDGIDCYYVSPKQGFKGFRFMVTNGKIARIEIESKEYATDKGAKIGDTEAKIKSLYKGVQVYPQKYDEKKNDMEVYSDDKQYLMIFETDGKHVTGFRAGKAEEVGYVEGCS